MLVGDGNVESLLYFYCKLYDYIRGKYINPQITNLVKKDREECLLILLSDEKKDVTFKFAQFS